MGEDFRGGVHAGVGAVVTAILLYNVMRIVEVGRQRHLLINVAVYVPLVAFEMYQARRHWRMRGQ